jgi:hypothetical protein
MMAPKIIGLDALGKAGILTSTKETDRYES